MEAINWSCHFSWVWSDIPRHTQSADKEQITNISVMSGVIVLIFYIQSAS